MSLGSLTVVSVMSREGATMDGMKSRKGRQIRSSADAAVLLKVEAL